MTAEEVWEECARLGILLLVDGGNLRVSAPKGTVTPALRRGLEACKPALLARLSLPGVRCLEVPLTSAQRAIWLLNQSDPASLPAYNLRSARRFRGPLDGSRLERSLRVVVARHDPLRAHFFERGGEPWQRIDDRVDVRLVRRDVSSLPREMREVAWKERLAAEGGRTFDLCTAPLFVAELIALAADEHILILNAHHLIADGWSAGLFLREVALVYGELGAGLHPADRPPGRFFAQAQAEQRRNARGEEAKAALAYWREHLTGVPALRLPADFSRTAEFAYGGASEAFELGEEATRDLRALARAEGSTLFHVLIASFAVLLQRLSGQDDFAIGTTLAGRETVEAEELIGYFVKLVAIRAELADGPSFRELLRRTREAMLAAWRHQQAPFDEVAQSLGLPRERSHHPVFQAMFLYLQAARDVASFPGLEAEPVPIASVTSKYDLSLHVEDRGDVLACLFEFNTALFAPASIRKFVLSWRTLLRTLASCPDASVTQVPVLDEAEAGRILRDFNASSAPLAAAALAAGVDGALARQARINPDAVALVHEDQSLSYRDLDRAADKLAAHLRSAGAGPERIVGLCAERSLELVIGLIAILKSGAAYLPLDPDYPPERLAFMLEDARPVALLASRGRAERLASSHLPVVFLDGLSEDDEAFETDLPAWGEPDRLAYVIYTSGSTGRPKGVMVTHRNVLNFFAGMDLRLGTEPGVWLALTSVSFDISVLELLWTLSRGFKVVVQSDRERVFRGTPEAIAPSTRPIDFGQFKGDAPTPGRSIAEQFARHAPTHLQATPSGIKMLLLDASAAGALSGLARLVVGGEALPRELAADLTARVPGGVENLYGPTETTVWSTGHRLSLDDPAVLIGRPLANTEVYVLDSHGEPVPVGVVGELYIGGMGVSRGYLGRPDLTAERFVPDSFSGKLGGRIYSTGDLARWREPGVLECLGRSDQQLKIRGHRIEPGEIESALARHPAVGQAVVVAHGGPEGDPRLIAYVVVADGATPRAAELRAFLAQALPESMIPAEVVFMGAFPLTPNGKIDRRALPAPEAAQAGDDGDDRPARTPEEEIVCEIWSEVLGRPRLGAHGHFFDLGGHSLLAMQMMARLRRQTGADLPLRSLFEEPTVAGFARRLARALKDGSSDQSPDFHPLERSGAIPLSFGQRRLWFIEQLEPGRATYNMPAALRLRGPCNPAALEASFAELIGRHEALRTRFPAPGGEPVQEVAPTQMPAMPIEDLSELPPGERELRARVRGQEEAQEPFDLSSGPLFRIRLFRLEAEHHLLSFVVHHIVSDAWTMGLIATELCELYAAKVCHRPASLLPLAAHYADFSAWQRGWLRPDALARRLAYWREHLAGGEPAEVPTDRSRPRGSLDGRGKEYRFVWPADLNLGLHGLARREGATLFMTLMAGLYALLARMSRQSELVIGTSVANRPRPEFEAMAGFFVNMLPLRVSTAGDPSFVELIARVKAACLGAYANQDTPFEALVDELAPTRDLSRTPFFQVMLVLLNTPAASLRPAGLEVTAVPMENRTAKFDLTLMAEEKDGELRWVAEYRTQLYDEETIARLTERLQRLLEVAVSAPERPLTALPILTPDERCREVEEENRPLADYSCFQGVHAEFAAQAARTPAAIAVSASGTSLTYAELDARANRLARCLRAQGAGPGSMVGLGLGRTLSLPVGILGILKSGAAYVPLDPTYPSARLAYTARDAGLKWALVDDQFCADLGPAVARIEVGEFALGPGEAEAPEDTVGPADAAYIIYTSGSTGAPKGVVVSHGNVTRLMRATHPWFGFGERDVWTLFHSSAFDFSVWEIWGALLYGGRLVIVPYETSRSPEDFHRLLVDERVSVLNQTPSAFRALIAADASAGGELALREVIFGGEALEPSILRSWIERHGDERPRLINMYGITETTVHTTYRRITRADLAAGGRSVIGRRIPDVSLYVVDEQLQPVPPGVPGELLVGGAGVALGYLNRPELDIARFVPNPFGVGRLYRSGDLARRLRGGDLEFLGRIDRQIKIRGFRIELGEIESVVAAHPGVGAVAVTARSNGGGATRLSAYVVARDLSAPPNISELRRLCRESLPDYMWPAGFVFLDRLPLTPNGKLDADALQDPSPDFEALKIAPRDPEEKMVAAIWEEVLACGPVGASDDFFSLGGQSLVATQVMTRLRERFAVELPLRTLFEHPTVEGLAGAIRSARLSAVGAALGASPRRSARQRRKITIGADGEVAAEETVCREN